MAFSKRQLRKSKAKSKLIIFMYISSFLLLLAALYVITQPSSSVSIDSNSDGTQSPPIQKMKAAAADDSKTSAVKYLRKALLHMERQEWRKVEIECDNAIARDPKMAYPHALKGNVLNLMNDWKSAAESWRMASTLEPDNFEYYYHLGFSLQQLSQDQTVKSEKYKYSKEGIASFLRYLELADAAKAPASQKSMAHTHLASIFKSIKTTDKQELAASHFQQAVNLDPTNELAFFNIGLMYADKYEKSGNDDLKNQALENINKAIKLDPTNTKFNLVREAIMGEIDAEELMLSMQHTEL